MAPEITQVVDLPIEDSAGHPITDGNSDYSDILQEFIDSLQPGTLVQGNGEVYSCDKPLVVTNPDNLSFGLADTTFVPLSVTGPYDTTQKPGQLNARSRAAWRFMGGHDVHFAAHIVGAASLPDQSPGVYNSKYEAQHGVDIQGTKNIEVTESDINDVMGDFVYWGPNLKTWDLSSGSVHDNTFDGSGRQGWSVTGGDGIEIAHNTIDHVARSLIDLEPTTATNWAALNVHMHHNEIGVVGLSFLACKGQGPNVDGIVIDHNHSKHRLVTTINASDGASRGTFDINNNSSDEFIGFPTSATNPHGCIEVRRVKKIIIAGNVQPMQPKRGCSFALFDSCQEGLYFWNTTDQGEPPILLGSNPNMTIAANRYVTNGPWV